ncbi:MAG: Galactose-1-phosphate uridylyltransferase, partial [Parcubacteria group bacterium Gr01-1014_66]
SLFHNHGRLAGATIAHPHSQIIALPVLPPDIKRSLDGARQYYEQHHECVHCVMVAYEKQEKKRVIYENEKAIVLAPYAARTAFELRIFPKNHQSNFEEIDERMRVDCAEAMRVALAKLYTGLNNPDYNFFIHTAPIHNAISHEYYHWHLEVLPKTAIWAGFEIGTGIEIATIAPEDTALFLRDIKI